MPHLLRLIQNRTRLFTIALCTCAFSTILISTAADATNLTSATPQSTSYTGVFPGGLTAEQYADKIRASEVRHSAGTFNAAGTVNTAGTLNTAGTVRVNNLANLESLLAILSNSVLVVAALWGGYLSVTATSKLTSQDKGTGQVKRLIMGLTIVVIGLATPGTINWLVASARDAGLCN